MSDEVFSVSDELYFTVTPNTKDKVSGSTITGVTDATLYCFNPSVIIVFDESVKLSPVVGLIDM